MWKLHVLHNLADSGDENPNLHQYPLEYEIPGLLGAAVGYTST